MATLKREVGGHALKSNGNYIVYNGKSWKNHGIMFLNFCGNLAKYSIYWHSSNYAVTHMRNKIATVKGVHLMWQK